MKVNLIIEMTERSIFAMYISTWQRRTRAYLLPWDKILCFSGKQESITGVW